MSINRVVISGNLTRDPEIRNTQSGMAVMGFGMAVNDRRKNPHTGEWEDYANYIDCTMFGTRAESVSRFLSKGTKVTVEGKLRWSQWERDGQKRSKVEVVVDEIELMSGGQRPQQAPQPQMAPPMQQGYAPMMQPQYQQPVPQYQQPAVYDEDIPF